MASIDRSAFSLIADAPSITNTDLTSSKDLASFVEPKLAMRYVLVGKRIDTGATILWRASKPDNGVGSGVNPSNLQNIRVLTAPY